MTKIREKRPQRKQENQILALRLAQYREAERLANQAIALLVEAGMAVEALESEAIR